MPIPGMPQEYAPFFMMMLCDEGQALDHYAPLFDFRPAEQKRRESVAICKSRRERLIEALGPVCMLRFALDCDPAAGIQVDHLIPLSSNVLNKEIRKAAKSNIAEGKRRKASADSFGSNHHWNLAIACKRCNFAKKHRMLDRSTIKRVILELQLID